MLLCNSTLTQRFIDPIENYITTQWVEPRNVDVFKKQIFSRGVYLVLAPCSALITVTDTVFGVFAGIISIASLGKNEKAFNFAKNYLDSSRMIIVKPYVNLLKSFNPWTCFYRNLTQEEINYRCINKLDYSQNFFFTCEGDGLIAFYTHKFLREKANDFYDSENFLIKNIKSRLTYSLSIIASIIARIADGMIATLAIPLSFLFFGRQIFINTVAYRSLQTPGIIKDVFYSTLKCIDPELNFSIAVS